MAAALAGGAVDGVLDDKGLSACDLILVALPPAAMVQWAEAHSARLGGSAVLVDLCGVKREMHEALSPIAARYGFTYVGGHPMAGKERGGFLHACDDLFLGAPMILTPGEAVDGAVLDSLRAFFLDIGFARVVLAAPDTHDQVIAYTSQLAHITSSAYIKSPTAQRHDGFSAGSYRDLTRVAELDEAMWTELFLANAPYLAEELSLLIQNLTRYLNALNASDADTLRALLREGRMLKAAAGGN